MAVPVLNYSTPRDDQAAKLAPNRQADLGCFLSLAGFLATLRHLMLAKTFYHLKWSVSLAVWEVGSVLAAIILVACLYRLRHGSWSFAKGAFIGAVLAVAAVLTIVPQFM